MSEARSANEIEALVLKAARGGGLPLGHAEDLAAAVAYLDLETLTSCPCHSGAAMDIPKAIDAVLAGESAQPVDADAPLVAAYCAAVHRQTGQAVASRETSAGVVIERVAEAEAVQPLGRRIIAQALGDHLADMAAKTLVPESEASRLAGAGAGLTDND